MSKNDKTCANGHIYEKHLEICPYCPPKSEGRNDNLERTLVDDGKENSPPPREAPKAAVNPLKTVVHKADDVSSGSSSHNRKLIGWLVSFTLNPDGDDYKIREGKTAIGASSPCEIILNDSEVSAHHATILFRKGKIRIKDEFSTNGTQLNGEDIEETTLKDGDVIKIGRSELKLRIA
jgi:hypothetical protein